MLTTAGAFPFIKTPADEVVEVVIAVAVLVEMVVVEVAGAPITVEVDNVNVWRAVMKNSWWINV